jgi:hypothetical protein
MFSRIFRRRTNREVRQVFEGEVIRADTRQPLSGTRVTILTEREDRKNSYHESTGLTNAAGCFRITSQPGKSFIFTAFPLAGEPYLIVEKRIELAHGESPAKIQFALPRGVLVHGKVTEAVSEKPVAEASILYDEHSRENGRYAPERVMPGWAPHSVIVSSNAEGRFHIAVPPGRGTLYIQGPQGDYIRQMMGSGELIGVPLPGIRHYFSAHVPLDVTLDDTLPELNISIRRGVTLSGRLVGPEGCAVGDVLMLSRLTLHYDQPTFNCEAITAREGKFELHGLDPDACVTVFFLDPKIRIGAVVELSGKSAENQPLVVRLSPCGKAIARFVDPEGKPRVNFEPLLHLVVTPGPSYGNEKRMKTELVADEDFVANFDRENYNQDGPVTDREGYCTFPALIPGATYRIPIFHRPGEWEEIDFSVRPLETLQLPDIVVTTGNP